MDNDIEALWEIFKHIFPDFTINHMQVYFLLWNAEPKSGEEVIKVCGLSRATTYKILKELVGCGLVKKTSYRPFKYFAQNPSKSYSLHCTRMISKLRKGKNTVSSLLSGLSSPAHSEIFWLKGDNGEQKLINKKTRMELNDADQLRELRRVVDSHLLAIDQQKFKSWMFYK